MRRVTSYYEYTTQDGDTLDYCDVIVFEGGVQLKLPVVEEAETSETVPPWRATA